jgi:polar amino acid transport system substrate-binding protein
MADDKVDVSKRMSTDNYHLYRLKGSKVDWDGKAFSNLDGRIGAQAGFSGSVAIRPNLIKCRYEITAQTN